MCQRLALHTFIKRKVFYIYYYYYPLLLRRHAKFEFAQPVLLAFLLLLLLLVGCVAQLAERRSLAGEVTLSCARPSANGWPLCG